MFQRLQEDILDAELVLVGIGEEMGVSEKELMNHMSDMDLANVESEQLLGYLVKQGFEKQKEDLSALHAAYESILQLLKDKNYFLVSVNTDGYALQHNFKEDRMVFPCGGYSKLQCPKLDSELLIDLDQNMIQWASDCLEKRIVLPAPNAKVCVNCGSELVFNNIYAEKYNENGYLDQWKIYTSWLQGTVNRKVCIIELGVGMKFPSVIRWPFEKIATYNKKAKFYRINSSLYQFPEGLSAELVSVAKNPIDFLTQERKN